MALISLVLFVLIASASEGAIVMLAGINQQAFLKAPRPRPPKAQGLIFSEPAMRSMHILLIKSSDLALLAHLQLHSPSYKHA